MGDSRTPAATRTPPLPSPPLSPCPAIYHTNASAQALRPPSTSFTLILSYRRVHLSLGYRQYHGATSHSNQNKTWSCKRKGVHGFGVHQGF